MRVKNRKPEEPGFDVSTEESIKVGTASIYAQAFHCYATEKKPHIYLHIDIGNANIKIGSKDFGLLADELFALRAVILEMARQEEEFLYQEERTKLQQEQAEIG
jgi:hypothetical protein